MEIPEGGGIDFSFSYAGARGADVRSLLRDRGCRSSYICASASMLSIDSGSLAASLER